MWPFSLSNFTPLTWFSRPSRPIEFTVLKDEQGDIIMEGCPPPWPRNTAEDVREQYERRLERVPSPQTRLALRSYGHVEGRFLPRLLAPRAFCAVKAARAALAHYGWRHEYGLDDFFCGGQCAYLRTASESDPPEESCGRPKSVRLRSDI